MMAPRGDLQSHLPLATATASLEVNYIITFGQFPRKEKEASAGYLKRGSSPFVRGVRFFLATRSNTCPGDCVRALAADSHRCGRHTLWHSTFPFGSRRNRTSTAIPPG